MPTPKFEEESTIPTWEPKEDTGREMRSVRRRRGREGGGSSRPLTPGQSDRLFRGDVSSKRTSGLSYRIRDDWFPEPLNHNRCLGLKYTYVLGVSEQVQNLSSAGDLVRRLDIKRIIDAVIRCGCHHDFEGESAITANPHLPALRGRRALVIASNAASPACAGLSVLS